MQKIQFVPNKGMKDLIYPPAPAIVNTPKWYKDLPSTISKASPTYIGNLTSKKCVPIFDSLTQGYYLHTWADVQVSIQNGIVGVNWQSPNKVIDTHPKSQVSTMPLPDGYYKAEAFKWINHIKVVTPPGYSTLFVSPTLRYDIPFWSFPGIVDTDTYSAAVNFPFLVKKNWEGIIPRGTPMIHVIPFKRDEWKSEYLEDEPYDNDLAIDKMKNHIMGAYKKKFWKRKRFI